jgi:uncharacterized membrane protein YfcA
VSLLSGSLAGAAGGFFGVGGGAILVPILTSRFKLTQHQAHGTSLAVIGAASLVSVVVYALHRNVAWIAAVVIGLASLVSARYGARLANRTSPRGLRRAFAVFLLLLAVRLFFGTPEHLGGAAAITPAAIGWMALLGLAVGVLAGYMGVGGGVLIVPGLTLLLGWDQHIVQGTSLAAILAAAPAGAVEHARHGNVVGRLVPGLALGAALGGPVGSLLALGLDRHMLTRCFALFLIAMAVVSWMQPDRKRPATLEPRVP